MFAPKVAKPGTKVSASPTNKLAPQPSMLAARRFGLEGGLEHLRMLQRSIGNQATLRLLAQRASSLTGNELYHQDAAPENKTARETVRGSSWDFTKIPLFPPDRIQPKLIVGAGDDQLEREADRVADQVTRMPEPQAIAPSEVHQTLNRPGHALEPPDRAFMESRFGHDFSKVRVHHDGPSAASATAVNALAYTVGPQVVFGPGRYRPQTADGRMLLAHELAHVVQQGGGPVPSGPLPMNPPDGAGEREAIAAAGRVLSGRALAPISQLGPSVARAPVSDYGGKEQLSIDRADVETAKKHVPGLEKLQTVFNVVPDIDVPPRFAKNAEERDAVYDVAWQVQPATLSGRVEKVVSIPASIPARGSAAALLYRFTFTPKDPTGTQPTLGIKFESEGPGAAIVSPSAGTGATRPAKIFAEGFPTTGNLAYFTTHADEAQQIYGWIAAQKADQYDQIIATSGTTGTGGKKHESSFRVKKAKGDPEIDIVLLGEFRLDEKSPGTDYRRDYADDLIAKAKAVGDPGQKTKPDKLGTVTGISLFPSDEQFSVKFFAYDLFKSETVGGKTSPGLRDAESKAVVNVEGSTKRVLIRVSIAKAATAGTYDMDVQRIGELGKDAEIDPAKAKPDVSRAKGYPGGGTAAAVSAFLRQRYKGLSGVIATTPATTPADVLASANTNLEAQAKTAAYFTANYGVSVLDAGPAATRLQTVNKQNALQTLDMGNFSDPELWSLELAFETLSDPLITVLKGTAFARQKEEIVDKGAAASPRFMASTEHSATTFPGALAAERTIVLYDQFHTNQDTSFLGSTKGGILPVLDFTILHEMGHAVDASTAARDAFNKKFPTLRGFTDYARSNKTKEAFEEAFAIFQGDPEWLKTNHNDVFAWFTTLSTSGRAPPP